MATLDNGGIRR